MAGDTQGLAFVLARRKAPTSNRTHRPVPIIFAIVHTRLA